MSFSVRPRGGVKRVKIQNTAKRISIFGDICVTDLPYKYGTYGKSLFDGLCM